MIIGGYDLSLPLDSVELHNWKTGEQCRSTSLPVPTFLLSGVVMQKMPAFCGGVNTNYASTCYKLDISKKTWTQVNMFFTCKEMWIA